MEFIVTINPDSTDIESVRQGLRQFNQLHLGEVADQNIACFVDANDGTRLGGIIGRAWGNWLMIQFLWVDPSLQRQGIGSELLNRLELQARLLGCKYALVDTLDFQARPFYQKNGYQCQMTLDNYPEQGQLHFMTKVLL